jgi:hypothetical protein
LLVTVPATRDGNSRYYPHAQIEAIENEVVLRGAYIRTRKAATIYKIAEFPHEIGASEGEPSRWVMVECTSNVFTGIQLASCYIGGRFAGRLNVATRVKQMSLPQIPEGWRALGDLPDVEATTAHEDDLELFSEDTVQLIDPTATYILDIGWYPAESRNGRFVCRLVYRREWDEPLEELSTRSSAVARSWLAQRLSDVSSLFGQPDRLQERIGDAILVVDTPPEELAAHSRMTTASPVPPPPNNEPITAPVGVGGVMRGSNMRVLQPS